MYSFKIHFISRLFRNTKWTLYCIGMRFFYPHEESYRLAILFLQYGHFQIFRINIMGVSIFLVALQETSQLERKHGATQALKPSTELFSTQYNLFTWQVKCFNTSWELYCLKTDRFQWGIFINSYVTGKRWPCKSGHWPLGSWIHTLTEHNEFDNFILSPEHHQYTSQTHILTQCEQQLLLKTYK